MDSNNKNSNALRPKAYSYARFSSSLQSEGTSLKRQIPKAIAAADKWGLDLQPANIMLDEGISAFRGKQVTHGALGAFLKAIETGKVKAGEWLLIEAFDRLSRQNVDEAMALFLSITNAGVIVATLRDEQVFKKPLNPNQLRDSLDDMIASNKESAKKAYWNKNAWEIKREEARQGGKKLTKICPAWMYLNDEGTAYVLIVERVEVVKRIFAMSANGLGIHVTTKTLNREGVKPFEGDRWTVDRVQAILRNRAVIGEYQPHVRVGRDKRQADGEPIQGYYPAIITEQEFYASVSARELRKTAGKGRKGETFGNLFSGVAYCSECGSKMYREQRNKYRSSNVLYCRQTRNGTCTSKTWQYDDFEKSFLSFVREVDLESVINTGTGSRIETINGELATLNGERQDIETKMKNLMAFIESATKPSPMLAQQWDKHQARLDWIVSRTEHVTKERQEIVASRRASKLVEFAGFPEGLSETELYIVRAKAAGQIRSVVERVELYRPNVGKKARQAGLWTIKAGGWAQPEDTPDSRFGRNFMVRFKGGASRLIYPDGQHAKEAFVVVNMDFPADQRDKLPKATRTPEEFARARAEH